MEPIIVTYQGKEIMLAATKIPHYLLRAHAVMKTALKQMERDNYRSNPSGFQRRVFPAIDWTYQMVTPR